MKRNRFLKTIGFLPIVTLLASSCVDSAYDSSNLDSEAILFGRSLKMPVGKTSIRLDSVIGNIGIDTSILQIKNGTYVFGYSGQFGIDNMVSNLSGFEVVSLTPKNDVISIYDGTVLPGGGNAPIPVSESEYNSETEITLPDFNTSLIEADTILLTNTQIRLNLSTTGLSGKDLDKCTSVTFTVVGDVADYYDLNGDKITSWTMKFNEIKTIELRRLRLSSGTKLKLSEKAVISVKAGDEVYASTSNRSELHIGIDYPNGIDFERAYGKIHYSTSGNVDPIDFDALGDILSENDVLSMYNPTINIRTKGNLGVPVLMSLGISATNTTTNRTDSATRTSFTVNATSNPDVDVESSATLNKQQNTSKLFSINPDVVNIGYTVATDPTPGKFISKNTHLNLSYSMELPFQFGNDLRLSVGNTYLKNPLKDNLKDLEDQDNVDVALLLNVKNGFPLQFQLQLTALDKDSVELFSVTSEEIEAADVDAITGFSTGKKESKASINLNTTQVNQLKDVAGFSPRFILTSNPSSTFVTVRPSDEVDISIGAKVSGGIKLDLDPEDDESN
jgi:hypothetical protein